MFATPKFALAGGFGAVMMVKMGVIWMDFGGFKGVLMVGGAWVLRGG